MTHIQREAVKAFDASLATNKQRALQATSSLNTSGLESLVGILRIIKDKVENGGAGYPADAEADVRALVAETKTSIAENATAHITAIEGIDDTNYAEVAATFGIEI